ncbi:hypothetical protein MCC01983_21260 [Bifidobacteriaceae bacterium MCC01983]|jgi:hypothetical protein|nr:hypothetical protein MCC01983_21260 [Bifidobacteriaceae bacterium MCC01983]
MTPYSPFCKTKTRSETMTTNVIDAIREKEADAHAEREEAFAERNRLNQAFFDGKLIAYAEILRLLGEDLEENDGYERN